jgi:hypothetical protein
MKTKKMLKRLRSNQILILLVLLAITVLIVVSPACANYITMANPQGIAERDILVYNSTGQLFGVINSTSTVELNSSQDYIFVLKPPQLNPFDDPADWFVNNVIPLVKNNAAVLIVMAFGIGLLGRGLRWW